MPNPNPFDGNVRLRRREDADRSVLPPVAGLFGAVGAKDQTRRALGFGE
ncbi:hypothetical protein [Nonomuraea sp. NPDC049784]